MEIEARKQESGAKMNERFDVLKESLGFRSLLCRSFHFVFLRFSAPLW